MERREEKRKKPSFHRVPSISNQEFSRHALKKKIRIKKKKKKKKNTFCKQYFVVLLSRTHTKG